MDCVLLLIFILLILCIRVYVCKHVCVCMNLRVLGTVHTMVTEVSFEYLPQWFPILVF